MRKILLVGAAIAALGFASPLLAEDAVNPAAQQPTAAAPVVQPDVTQQATNAAPQFIGQQQDGQMLASNIIGKTVTGPNDENLGDVNDIILGADGQPDAVVIGVGGFLGLGEKNVAVPFDTITSTTDTDGNLKLSLNTTKEALDAAPAFESLAMLKQKQQQDLDATQPLAPAPAEPAPVPAPNPAG